VASTARLSFLYIPHKEINHQAASIRTRFGFLGKWRPCWYCWVCFTYMRQAGYHHMGLWLLSMSAGQRGGQCCTLAVNVEMGPVFHSHSSQMTQYSAPPPPPFIPPFPFPRFPPPINDPFVRVFLPRWAGRPQHGPVEDQPTFVAFPARFCDSRLNLLCSLLLSFFFLFLYFTSHTVVILESASSSDIHSWQIF